MLVKVCGLTRVEDALGCLERGVDAIGLNLWPGSPRRCTEAQARRILDAVGARLRVVAVTVDADEASLRRLRDEVGIPWLQLHGDEPASLVEALLPRAMKAVRLGGPDDLAAARATPGEELLVDARVAGQPGGTGVRCDWESAAQLAAERRIWLAGGLRPENVREAIEAVRPMGVDLASGVERAPGIKDLDAVEALVRAAR